jgi:hypothetical protein
MVRHQSQSAWWLAAAALAAAGCFTSGSSGSRAIHLAPAQYRSSMTVVRPGPGKSAKPRHSSAALVEASLHARGIRFGTDGTVPALYGFVQGQFPRIQPEQARAGDVVFFDLGGGCGNHVGLVEASDAEGRIGFREWRDGYPRHSFVTPRQPLLRRDVRGRILNTFLRPKRQDDPSDARYFAGEMLCAVFHVESAGG